MYEAICGILHAKEPHKVVVETGGVFYRLLIPFSTYSQLPAPDHSIFFYLSYIVREDSQTLYAFLKKEERDLFEQLISVSGIGPKTALGIIGHIEIEAFHNAILLGDTTLLSKIPGVGKKTAERLILEMKDPLRVSKVKITFSTTSITNDAMQALLNLGYNLPHAKKAIDAALKEGEETDLAKLISLALQKIRL
ncbi:MAG: Holliday junction branch migration protein RuvA [Chlamydiia bacterium]|nr:Holliday junction branch migration protein RuvA [Chlamydiia bacterium]